MDDFVESVRAFNRFYTRQIGLLGKAYLRSPFSLTEVRVLYELTHRDGLTASQLGRDLDLDAGYLSRILDRFEHAAILRRRVSQHDGRQSLLHLTAKGCKRIAPLVKRSRAQVRAMTARLTEDHRIELKGAMRTIERLLGESSSGYSLREHRSGDMGWVVYRHGVLYGREYGYDESFEALVADITAKFIQNLDHNRERCWMAERDGAIAGSVFLVRHSDETAKLRLLLVEPWARGLGLGRRLVDECVAFARESGYRKIRLWTQSELIAARRTYEKAGFKLISSEAHHSFGKNLVAETWELVL